MRRVYAAAFLILTAFCGPSLKAESLEHDLAVINAKGYVADDDITIKRFRALLGQLDATFPENRQQIADKSVWAINRLRDDGIEQNLLELMEGMNQLFSRPVENQKYADYLAAYLTFRLRGKPHAECVDGLKGLIQGLGIGEAK
jgi:hypothetical protein